MRIKFLLKLWLFQYLNLVIFNNIFSTCFVKLTNADLWDFGNVYTHLRLWECIKTFETLEMLKRIQDFWECLHTFETRNAYTHLRLWECLHTFETFGMFTHIWDFGNAYTHLRLWECLHTFETLGMLTHIEENHWPFTSHWLTLSHNQPGDVIGKAEHLYVF